MAEQKTSKLGDWFGKLLYALMVSYHHEDYISEQDGKTVVTPADVWHKNAMSKVR